MTLATSSAASWLTSWDFLRGLLRERFGIPHDATDSAIIQTVSLGDCTSTSPSEPFGAGLSL